MLIKLTNAHHYNQLWHCYVVVLLAYLICDDFISLERHNLNMADIRNDVTINKTEC